MFIFINTEEKFNKNANSRQVGGKNGAELSIMLVEKKYIGETFLVRKGVYCKEKTSPSLNVCLLSLKEAKKDK